MGNKNNLLLIKGKIIIRDICRLEVKIAFLEKKHLNGKKLPHQDSEYIGFFFVENSIEKGPVYYKNLKR